MSEWGVLRRKVADLEPTLLLFLRRLTRMVVQDKIGGGIRDISKVGAAVENVIVTIVSLFLRIFSFCYYSR